MAWSGRGYNRAMFSATVVAGRLLGRSFWFHRLRAKQNFKGRRLRRRTAGLALLAAGCLPAADWEPEPPPGKPVLYAYVGTYTGGKSEGIYAFRVDPDSGAAAPLGCVARAVHPSFLALSADGRFLYSVSESGGGPRGAGAVSAYAIQPADGALRLLNQQTSGGAGPCHLTVDAAGRGVLVANYGGGSVAALALREDGSLGPVLQVIQHRGSSVHPQRQRQPHAHSVNLSPDQRFALVADLGLDQVLVYACQPGQGLREPAVHVAHLPPGSGPRHLAFHPDGLRVLVINELLSTLTVCDFDPDSGRLIPGPAVSTLPADFQGANTTAEVVVHPGGRWVYGSNRGHDSLAVFALGSDGRLDLLEHVPTGGRTPRNFALTLAGDFLWVANQNSDLIVIFRVDPQTGRLQATGQALEVGAPVCVRFLQRPAGKPGG